MVFPNITNDNSQAIQNNGMQLRRAVIHFVQSTYSSGTVYPCPHSSSSAPISSKFIATKFRSFHGNVWQSPVGGWWRRVEAVSTAGNCREKSAAIHLHDSVKQKIQRRTRSQVRPPTICGERNGTAAGVLRVLRFPLPILIP
jgi:hypothetical protein